MKEILFVLVATLAATPTPAKYLLVEVQDTNGNLETPKPEGRTAT